MDKPLEVKTYRHPEDRSITLAVKFEEQIHEAVSNGVFREIIDKIAERWVAENYQLVAERMSPDAIATLVVAEGAAKIRETLENNIPGRVETIVKNHIYKQGFFGSLKRVR